MPGASVTPVVKETDCDECPEEIVGNGCQVHRSDKFGMGIEIQLLQLQRWPLMNSVFSFQRDLCKLRPKGILRAALNKLPNSMGRATSAAMKNHLAIFRMGSKNCFLDGHLCVRIGANFQPSAGFQSNP